MPPTGPRVAGHGARLVIYHSRGVSFNGRKMQMCPSSRAAVQGAPGLLIIGATYTAGPAASTLYGVSI